jgi:uncharacterized integral membrane protein
MSMSTKLWVAAVVLLLVLIFVFQNTAAVPVRFLFWQFPMSLAPMIFLLLGAGVLIGWVAGSIARRSRR